MALALRFQERRLSTAAAKEQCEEIAAEVYCVDDHTERLGAWLEKRRVA